MFPPKPAQVENLFRQSAEFCSEHEVWKLNVAHVFFMQVSYIFYILIYSLWVYHLIEGVP